MELIIKDAVLSHIESNDLITGHQHGFVSGRSSLTNCWRSLRRGLRCLTQDAVSTSSACTIKKRSTQYHTEDCCRNSMFGRVDINRDFLNKNQKIRFFRPPGPAAAGRVGLYILLLSFFFCHGNLYMRIGQSAARQSYKTRLAVGDAHKISTDIQPILPPLFTGGQYVPNFGPNFDPSRLRTVIFLNCGSLLENKNKLVKDR